MKEILCVVAKEIEAEIKADGMSPQNKAWLYHQLGSVYMMIGKKDRQKKFWKKAYMLDPESEMIKNSLQSLT